MAKPLARNTARESPKRTLVTAHLTFHIFITECRMCKYNMTYIKAFNYRELYANNALQYAD